jgi:hypothetical protein
VDLETYIGIFFAEDKAPPKQSAEGDDGEQDVNGEFSVLY